MAIAFDSNGHSEIAWARSIAIAIATSLVLGLAGCAAEMTEPGSSASADTPYVGVFTGDYVDGKPLYRFPPIYVAGSRSSVGGI